MPDDLAKDDLDNIALADELARIEAAALAARDAERMRCTKIAIAWARSVDSLLGAGWRNAAELDMAQRVAMGIAAEISMRTNADQSLPETSDE